MKRRFVWPSRWVPTESAGDLWLPGPRRIKLWTDPNPLAEITADLNGVMHELVWVH